MYCTPQATLNCSLQSMILRLSFSRLNYLNQQCFPPPYYISLMKNENFSFFSFFLPPVFPLFSVTLTFITILFVTLTFFLLGGL